jgi:hypothetical protein
MWFSTNEDLVRELLRERERQLKQQFTWQQLMVQQHRCQEAPAKPFWHRIMAAAGIYRPRATPQLEVVGVRTHKMK